jgi:hypothetical protein
MPNHIHLLVKQTSKIPIYKFVSSLHTSYSMYFNKKYKRVGHLFQDRFKQKNIIKNKYLLYLSCYIHLNPEIDRLVHRAEKYPWSSYVDYIGLRKGTLCDKTIIENLIPAEKGQSFNDAYQWFVKNNKNFIFKRVEIKDQLRDCP